MERLDPIGLIHPGEMGVSLAATASASGREVLWASEGRSPSTRKRAIEHGLTDAASIGGLVDRSRLIISVCPPHAAEQVAQRVMEAGFRGVFLDANAISPQRSIAMAALMSRNGISFVDGGIVGEPAWQEGTTWLHLSGRDAEAVAHCFSRGPLQTTILGDTIGSASALKMCFAANTKGTTALMAAILGTAERMGVREPLERQWDDRRAGFSQQVSRRIQNAVPKAWRFVGEMEEIATTFREAGMPGEFHEAAREVYRRIAPLRDIQSGADLSDVLAALFAEDDRPPLSAAPDPTAFRIAAARERDIPSLLRLIRGLAAYERMTDSVSATQDRLRATLFGPRPAAAALLGFVEEEAVGMAIYFENYSTFLASPGLHLEDLFVDPDWRGRGLGEKLLRRVAAVATEKGYPRLEWAVLDWNKPAIDFYAKRGAKVLKDWKLCRVSGEALSLLASDHSP